MVGGIIGSSTSPPGGIISRDAQRGGTKADRSAVVEWDNRIPAMGGGCSCKMDCTAQIHFVGIGIWLWFVAGDRICVTPYA